MPFLPEYSWVKAREVLRKVKVAILPVGSVEQHGPQNPLGTDYLIAWELAKAAAKKTGELLLPPIPYGVSEHHSHFDGTIWVDEEALENYVYGVVRSLAKWGIRKVVIVNGHGGNLYALLRASARARKELKSLVVIYQWWTAASDELGRMFRKEELGHAGSAETSLIAYLYPDYVDPDKAVDEEVSPLFTVKVVVYWCTHDFTKSGVFGVAKTASRSRGEEVFNKCVDQLAKLIEEVRKFSVERL